MILFLHICYPSVICYLFFLVSIFFWDWPIIFLSHIVLVRFWYQQLIITIVTIIYYWMLLFNSFNPHNKSIMYVVSNTYEHIKKLKLSNLLLAYKWPGLGFKLSWFNSEPLILNHAYLLSIPLSLSPTYVRMTSLNESADIPLFFVF